MPVIDSKVHAYEANTPKRPWRTVPNWPAHVTGDEMVEAMDKVGVDGAIFISANSLYGYDASYAVEVQRAHLGRFSIAKPVDPDDPAVADVIADWKKTAGAVGIRIFLRDENPRPPTDAAFHPILRGPPPADGCRLRPDPAGRRPARSAGQFPVLGQARRGHPADRPPSQRALHH